VETRISHGEPDPIRLRVKFNIAETRFLLSKIIGIYMFKHNMLLLMDFSLHRKCLYLWHDILHFLLELLFVLYDFVYLALI
jgi:hypothetical protein